MGGCCCLERRESAAFTPPGLRLRSPQNHEEESPAGNSDTGLLSQTRGGVTNSAACLGMSACTAYPPPGLRLSAACLGMSTCTACTPPGLRLGSPWNPEEESTAGNPKTQLLSLTRGRVTNSATCLGLSACTSSGLLWELWWS